MERRRSPGAAVPTCVPGSRGPDHTRTGADERPAGAPIGVTVNLRGDGRRATLQAGSRDGRRRGRDERARGRWRGQEFRVRRRDRVARLRRPGAVVVSHVGVHDPPEMRDGEKEEVVEGFLPQCPA